MGWVEGVGGGLKNEGDFYYKRDEWMHRDRTASNRDLFSGNIFIPGRSVSNYSRSVAISGRFENNKIGASSGANLDLEPRSKPCLEMPFLPFRVD